MSVAFSQTPARMEGPAAMRLGAIGVCVLMGGAGPTALRISTTATQQHAVLAPRVSTALHLSSVSAPMERQVGLKEETVCRNVLYYSF